MHCRSAAAAVSCCSDMYLSHQVAAVTFQGPDSEPLGSLPQPGSLVSGSGSLEHEPAQLLLYQVE